MKIVSEKMDSPYFNGFIYHVGFEFEEGDLGYGEEKDNLIVATIPLKRNSSRLETMSHMRAALFNLIDLIHARHPELDIK